jgi:hypothetical protein
MSELTLTLALNARLDRRLKEEAERSGVDLRAWITEQLAQLVQVCPVCGHEGPGIRIVSFDGVDGTCACPLTDEDEQWVKRLADAGRLPPVKV